MKIWGIVPENFRNNEPEKFLKSDKKIKVLQHHINQISAAESAKSKGENIDDEANSTEINNAEGDEVTVNLTEKESSQKRRKNKRKMRRDTYKLEKWIDKEGIAEVSGVCQLF